MKGKPAAKGRSTKREYRTSYGIPPKKTYNRIAAERYIRGGQKFFAASVTHEDIERAIQTVERALDDLDLKPVKS